MLCKTFKVARMAFFNVQSVEWSKVDGNIYFTAEDKDCVHLFQFNPKSGKFTLLKTPAARSSGKTD